VIFPKWDTDKSVACKPNVYPRLRTCAYDPTYIKFLHCVHMRKRARPRLPRSGLNMPKSCII
jgi:hypothetical protein